MEDPPPSPSANISAQPSYNTDYNGKHITSEDPDASDCDEEPPELLSQSEDDSDFWEDFEDSDSEDEVIIVDTTACGFE